MCSTSGRIIIVRKKKQYGLGDRLEDTERCNRGKDKQAAFFFFFFKQKTKYEIMPSLVGSEVCIRDRRTYTHIRTTADETHTDQPKDRLSRNVVFGATTRREGQKPSPPTNAHTDPHTPVPHTHLTPPTNHLVQHPFPPAS